MSPIRPDMNENDIKVVYTNPHPYITISGGPFTHGTTINYLRLTPQEAEELSARLQSALRMHRNRRKNP